MSQEWDSSAEVCVVRVLRRVGESPMLDAGLWSILNLPGIVRDVGGRPRCGVGREVAKREDDMTWYLKCSTNGLGWLEKWVEDIREPIICGSTYQVTVNGNKAVK
jgi:hypothetical protein